MITLQSSLAQDNTNQLTKYENSVVGIRLFYPSSWALGKLEEDNECPDLCSEVWQILDRRDAAFPDGTVVIEAYNFKGPTISGKCNSLIEFMKFRYNETKLQNRVYNFSLINENKTEIGKHYPAWQIEYLTSSFPGKALKIFAQTNNTFYEMSYYAFDKQLYSKHLPEVKKLLNIIEFFPPEAQGQVIYKSYINPNLGFSIEHPRKWPLVNQTLSDEIMFRPPDSIMPMFVVRTTELPLYLDTDTMTLKNKTLFIRGGTVRFL